MCPCCRIAFLPGSAGPGELALIFLVVLVLFGPKRLPHLARSLGRILSQLRRASQDFRDQIMAIDDTPVSSPGASELTSRLENDDGLPVTGADAIPDDSMTDQRPVGDVPQRGGGDDTC